MAELQVGLSHSSAKSHSVPRGPVSHEPGHADDTWLASAAHSDVVVVVVNIVVVVVVDGTVQGQLLTDERSMSIL